MTSPLWPLRKRWRQPHLRTARLRALWWVVVRRHETELCCRCGGPVRVVFHVPDRLWAGFAEPWDVLCVPCADALALRAGTFLRWTCSDDDGPLLEESDP